MQTANRSEIAQIMGVSEPTIDRWIKEGMPVVVRGGRGIAWQFNPADVVRWHVERRVQDQVGDTPSDLAEIEKRTAAAKMARAELELAKARGDVAPVRDFERAQARAFAEIRSRIMNVPQRVVVQLLGETDEKTFKAKLTAELRLALEAAAEAKVTLAEDEETDNDTDD